MADEIIDKAKIGKKLVIRSAEEAGIVVPDGKKFVGWSTEPNGQGLKYKPGQKVTMYTKFDLYPVFVDADSEDVSE